MSVGCFIGCDGPLGSKQDFGTKLKVFKVTSPVAKKKYKDEIDNKDGPLIFFIGAKKRARRKFTNALRSLARNRLTK